MSISRGARSSGTKPTVLVVDDEAAIREVLEMRLQKWGFEVSLAATGEEASLLAEKLDPDVVLSDVVLPEMGGLDLLRCLKAGNSDRPVLLMTAYGSIDTAVEAMKEGAQDFLTKPLDYSKLKATLWSLREMVARRGEMARLSSKLKEGGGLGPIVGLSKPMRALFKLVRTLATNEASVIITGESGTGKEVVAQTIHAMGNRAAGPFVAVNSAAIPEGLIESEIFGHERGSFTGALSSRPGCFEQADKGTLFLDEIGEMPAQLQPKLLRILEESSVRRLGGRRQIPFDVRVMAATNRSPDEAVRTGVLRRDLFYRLNVFTIHMPPLRQREGDVELLMRHFIDLFNTKHGGEVEGASGEAAALLMNYPWPGNVRELRNVIERGVILAERGWLEAVHLPPYVRRPDGSARTSIVLPAGVSAAEAEKILLLKTLEQVGNNKAEAARQLGLDAKTIRNKLKSYGVRALS